MNQPTKPSDCEGKSRFSSFRSFRKAERSAGRIAKREGTAMHVYPCRQCGGFHVGSTVPGGAHKVQR